MNPIQKVLDTTVERFNQIPNFDERHFAHPGFREDVKSFIRAEQLAVLGAVQEIVRGMKEEDNYSTAYADYTEKKAIENSRAILNYNHALKDLLSALDLNKE